MNTKEVYNDDKYLFHLYDTYTQFNMVWTLHSKDQATLVYCLTNAFKFAASWGFPIKFVRLDGDSALRSALDVFTATSSIRPMMTLPDTSDQNGTAERPEGC
jgi:hypothetical protein